MRASVQPAWITYANQFEGRCSWMYCDTKGLVTTGTGNLIDSIAVAQALPWLTTSNHTASPAEIENEWRKTKANRIWKTQHVSGFGYQKYATLHLDNATIDNLLLAKTAEFWVTLAKTLPALDTYPADAQLALMDLAWQNGAAFLKTWNDTRASILALDFDKTAALLASFLPATAARTKFRVRLFKNAADVLRLGLDPDVLWDTKTPTKPAEPQPEPSGPTPTPEPSEGPVANIKHSSKYDCDYVWYGRGGGHAGGWVPVNVARVLDAVAAETGKPIYLSQGGLSGAVKASANTHKGLGAFDIALDGRTKAQVWTLTSVLRRSGIDAFPRGFTWDSFQGRTLGNLHDGNEHIHCVSYDNEDNLDPSAWAQVKENLKGGDGLVGSARYTGPSTPLEHWATSPYNPKHIREGKGVLYVASGQLLGLDVDRVQREDKDRGAKINYRKQVKRWGRWNAVTVKGTYFAIADKSQTYLTPDAPSTREAA